MRYRFIKEHGQVFPVDLQCQVLKVARSGYYRWLGARAGAKAARDAALGAQIQLVFDLSRSSYGSPRVQKALGAAGVRCGRGRVARLMRERNLVGSRRRRFRVTTNSAHALPVAGNLLARRFGPSDAVNTLWTSDITYIATSEGWLYLAVVMDIASRRIIGWSMSERSNQKLVRDALIGAVRARRPSPGLIVHSDRGINYAWSSYRQLLAELGMIQSMSRKANCWDNAPMESFFHSLKAEWIAGKKLATRALARSIVFDYIEVWYNRQRLHSTLGYQSPADYESGLAA
jgi:transposase InsO family protein